LANGRDLSVPSAGLETGPDAAANRETRDDGVVTTRRAALLDMDRTLVRVDTATLYVRYQRDVGEATWLDAARVACAGALLKAMATAPLV
jgi:hypothetical protein